QPGQSSFILASNSGLSCCSYRVEARSGMRKATLASAAPPVSPSPPAASAPHPASAEVARMATAAKADVRILILFTGSFLTRYVQADDLVCRGLPENNIRRGIPLFYIVVTPELATVRKIMAGLKYTEFGHTNPAC